MSARTTVATVAQQRKNLSRSSRGRLLIIGTSLELVRKAN